MEQSGMTINKRKESVSFDDKVEENECELLDSSIQQKSYPFALVLRLRVLQIVCGISALIMGTVAFIEEKGKFNLGLGIPAGASTIVAAAASIHTSRGFGGYSPSSCVPGAPLRFLGPSVRVAAPIAILWSAACTFQTALVVRSGLTLFGGAKEEAIEPSEGVEPDGADLVILASVELGLAVLTMMAVVLVLRIDCRYDPD